MSGDRSETSFLGRVIDLFLVGQLPAFLIALSLAGGVLALLAHAARGRAADRRAAGRRRGRRRPGSRVEEVERQVATRLEKLLAQIDGVEYVYSMSLPGRAIVTVRFFVGEDREDSLVKIYNKLESNRDLVPPLGDELGGEADRDRRRADPDRHALERSPAAGRRLRAAPDRRGGRDRSCRPCRRPTASQVVGGRPRAVRVELRTEALAARQTSAARSGLGARRVERARARRLASTAIDRNVAGGRRRVRRRTSTRCDGLVVNVVDGTARAACGDVADDRATVPTRRRATAGSASGPADARAAEADASGDGVLYPAVHVAVAKQQRHRTRWTSPGASKRSSPSSRRTLPARRRARAHHPQLRRDGQREGQRAGRGSGRRAS